MSSSTTMRTGAPRRQRRPTSPAENELEQVHFVRLRSIRPERDRVRVQAKLDKRFGPGAFVLLDDGRPYGVELYLSDNPDRPHQPEAAVAEAQRLVAKRFGPPHAVTRSVPVENRAQLTAWDRLEAMRQNLPPETEVWLQQGPTPNTAIYQIITSPAVDPQVRDALAAAAKAVTEEQEVAEQLREWARGRDDLRDPDGTEGYDPIREYSIDRETGVLNDVAARLDDGSLTLDGLYAELFESDYYYWDSMTTEEAQRLSDYDLGSHEGEMAAWGWISSVFGYPDPDEDPAFDEPSAEEEEAPDPSVAGAGSGPLSADSSWNDYVNAHGGPEASGWWVTLCWYADSENPRPEVVGPYTSYDQAVSAMEDSLLIDSFAEDTKREEWLDDVYVATDPAPIAQMCTDYGNRVTLIDPGDPHHFGRGDLPVADTQSESGISVWSAGMQAAALTTTPPPPIRPAAGPHTIGNSGTSVTL